PPPLGHPPIHPFPYLVRLLIILVVDAACEEPDLVVWVLVSLVIATVIRLLGLLFAVMRKAELRGAFRDDLFDLVFAGAFPRGSEVRSGCEARGTATEAGDVVLGGLLVQEIPSAGHLGSFRATIRMSRSRDVAGRVGRRTLSSRENLTIEQGYK